MKRTEDIEQLLRRFIEPAEAKQAGESIREGDRLFDAYPAPAANAQTVARLQNSVRMELRRRHRTNRYLAWGSAAAAIAVILLAGIYAFYEQPTAAFESPGRAAGSRWPQASDVRLTLIDSELNDIAKSMDAIRSENSDFAGSQAIDLMELEELEQVALNTDFWKG